MTKALTLREARRLTGLSQHALAKLAGVKGSAIADVEGGRVQRPSFDFVVRVVRALHRKGLGGITPEQLFPVSDGDQAVDETATEASR